MTTTNLRITSLNARGLISDMKRKKIFLWLEKQAVDITFLQETHCTKTNLEKISKDWGGRSYFGLTNSCHSRGVGILFKPSLDIEILNTVSRNDGRAMLMNITSNDSILTIVNIYAPNKEQERMNYFTGITTWIMENATSLDNLIIGGDLNICMNDNDRSSKTHLKDKSRQTLKRIMETINVEDVWEKFAKQKDHFTWSDNNIKSRLDYFLVGKSRNFTIRKTFTERVVSKHLSDHKALSLTIKIHSSKRGPGCWKLNTRLLKDKTYVESMESVLVDFMKRDANMNYCNKWEMIKIKIKETSIQLSKEISRNRKCKIQLLEEEIHKTENEVTKAEKQQQLQKYYTEEVIGAQIRSKVEKIDDSEFNTKLFKAIEKSKQIRNTIDCLKLKNGKDVHTSGEIMKVMNDFYKDLYASKNIPNDRMENVIGNVQLESTLSDSDRLKLESEVTKNEIQQALNHIKENKSPGSDGIPIEFYKHFWPLLEDLYFKMITESKEDEILPFTTRTALLSLIHKKGDKTNLANYRPLSLNNTDYKIIAQVYSNRLQNVIDKIIQHDQTAYIKGRNITTSVRKLLDVYELVEQNNTEGAMICIDFEKAFDSIEHNFIFKTLEKFNFGPSYIKWIKLFYTSPTFNIKNNGWLSPRIVMERGIRQGCSLSALLFILVAEILAQMVRTNEKLQGIKISGTEIKLAQYADDATIFVRDLTSIDELLESLKRFELSAGLKLNIGKTKGIWLGKLKELGLRIYKGIHFTGNPVKCLGIYIGHNAQKCEDKNWNEKLNSLQKTVSYWKTRNLSLFARVKVIKTYFLSKFTFTASLLKMPDNIVKQFKTLCYNYLWNGKRDKIKRSTITASVENGGLNMIDIDNFLLSLKATWISKYISKPGNWKCTLKHYATKMKFQDPLYLFKLNFSDIENFTIVKMLPSFYVEVITAFNKCKHQIDFKQLSNYHFLTQPLWGNKHFTANGKCLYFPEWINSNILYLKDLINEANQFLSDEELYNRIDNKRNFVKQIYMIKNYVYKKCRDRDLQNARYVKLKEVPTLLLNNKFCVVRNLASRSFYQCLMRRQTSRGNMESIWAKLFTFPNCNTMWKKIYAQNVIDLRMPKVAEFNFKVLHNILPCGKVLNKWIPHISDKCKSCNEIENTEHMLYKCTKVKPIWQIVSECLKINVKWKNIVCGYLSSESSSNVVFMNSLISVISYSIFKFNNREKWNREENKCKLEQYIVRNLLFFKLLLTDKNDNMFCDKRFEALIEYLL